MSSMPRPGHPGRPNPIAELVKFGKLEDVLKSPASPELKAACIVMAIQGKARQNGKPVQQD